MKFEIFFYVVLFTSFSFQFDVNSLNKVSSKSPHKTLYGGKIKKITKQLFKNKKGKLSLIKRSKTKHDLTASCFLLCGYPKLKDELIRQKLEKKSAGKEDAIKIDSIEIGCDLHYPLDIGLTKEQISDEDKLKEELKKRQLIVKDVPGFSLKDDGTPVSEDNFCKDCCYFDDYDTNEKYTWICIPKESKSKMRKSLEEEEVEKEKDPKTIVIKEYCSKNSFMKEFDLIYASLLVRKCFNSERIK